MDKKYYMPTGLTALIVRASLIATGLFFSFIFAVLLWYSDFALAHLALLVILIALYRPFYCLYLLAIILPLFGNNPGGDYSLYFIDMIVMTIVLRWLWPLTFKKQIQLRKTPFDIPIFFFVFLSGLSIIPLHYDIYDEYLFFNKFFPFIHHIYTTYATTLRWSLRAFLDLFLAVLLFYYIVNNLRELRQLRNLIRCFLASLFASLILGILDYHNFINLEIFRPLNKDILQFGYKRLQSLFWHSGWFAEYVTAIAPFYLAAVLLRQRRTKSPSYKTSWIYLIPLYLIIHGLLFTYARGGWLTFLASSCLVALLAIYSKTSPRGKFAVLLNKPKFWLALLILLLALAVILIGGMILLHQFEHPLYQRFFNLFNYGDRLHIWDAALTMYAKYPIFGIGLGNHFYRHLCQFTFPHPFWFNDKVTAHSTYIHILVERGPFALFAFICILIAAFILAAKSFKNSDSTDARHKFIAGAIASLFALSVYAFFQYIFYIRIIELYFWILLALIFCLIKTDIDEIKPIKSKTDLWILIFVILVILSARLQNTRFKDLYLKTFYDNHYWIAGKRITFVRTHIEKPFLKTLILMKHPHIQERPVKLEVYASNSPIISQTYDDYRINEELLYLPDFIGRNIYLRFDVDRSWRLSEWGGVNFQYNFGPNIKIPVEPANFNRDKWGFYPPETSDNGYQQWTKQRAAMRLVAKGETLILPLMAGNHDLPQNPLKVTIFLNSSLANTIYIKERNKWYDVPVTIPMKKDVQFILGIIPQRTWQPSKHGNDDSRKLGVLVGEPRWQ